MFKYSYSGLLSKFHPWLLFFSPSQNKDQLVKRLIRIDYVTWCGQYISSLQICNQVAVGKKVKKCWCQCMYVSVCGWGTTAYLIMRHYEAPHAQWQNCIFLQIGSGSKEQAPDTRKWGLCLWWSWNLGFTMRQWGQGHPPPYWFTMRETTKWNLWRMLDIKNNRDKL